VAGVEFIDVQHLRVAMRRRRQSLQRSARLAAVLALGPLFACAAAAPVGSGLTTAPYDPAARFRAVHIDTLDPLLQPIFESRRREWLKVLAAHGTTDGRGYFLEVDRHTLLTLRSFNSFTEYDALREFRSRVDQRLGPSGADATQRYDSGDVALRTPHNSEVWSRDADSDYRGANNGLDEYSAGYLQMIVEHVDSDEYAKAWKEIDAALRIAKYPLTRIAFFSSLGSGNHISFWLAASRKAFDDAGTPLAAVEKSLGTQQAQALFERYKAASSGLKVHEVVPRPELRSPD
jgi:hypothetical protein